MKLAETQLFVDTLPLDLGAVGIGSYTRDLIRALGNSSIASSICLLVPSWLAREPTVTESKLSTATLAIPERLPRTLRNMFWMERVGLFARKFPGAQFHSPALFASVFASPTTFVTCHDCLPLRYPVYLGRYFFRSWQYQRTLRFLRRCRGIFTDSHASKEDLIELCGLPSENIRVMPCWTSQEFNPSSAQAQAQGVRQNYKLPSRFWLYLGGYDVRKNVEFLLQAYADVRKKRPDSPSLVLAGKVPSRVHPSLCNVHGAIQSLGLEDSVMLPGFVPDNDLPGLYGAAEMLVFPSEREGFGLPPLEAMASGCPALAADNSSLKEVVEDNSYRFSLDSVRSLTEKLMNAIDQPLAMNPSFFPGRFSVERSIQIYLETLGLSTLAPL